MKCRFFASKNNFYVTDSESSTHDACSSFDSDLDPSFLPSSEGEILYSSEEEGIRYTPDVKKNKRKLFSNRNKFSNKKSKSENENLPLEMQPCCSKSIETTTFRETKDLTEANKGEQDDADVSDKELDEFFQVDISVDINNGNAANTPKDTENDNRNQEHTWRQPEGNHFIFDYSAEAGLHANYAAVLINDLSPYKCFRTFVDDQVINEMVNQTNLYATQILCQAEDVSKGSRLHRWTPTDKKKCFNLLALWLTWVW